MSKLGSQIFALTVLGCLPCFSGYAQAPGLQWARVLNGTGTNLPEHIVTDGSNNVYTVGSFRNTMDADPGPGVYTLTSAGTTDIFISKLDAGGNFVWAVQIGSANGEVAKAVAIDGSDRVYITGSYVGTVDFDPGPGTFNLTGGGAFALRLNSNGTFSWAGRIGNGSGNAITIDLANNLVIAGDFTGSSDFDPGAGTITLTSAGGRDIFVSKFLLDGSLVWVKQLGGTLDDAAYGVASDASGNIYTAGGFYGTADFNPGGAVNNMTSAGGDDIYVSKLDAAGNYVWAVRIGDTGSDRAHAITADGSGNTWVTGPFNGTVDFDPGGTVSNLTSAGSSDIFVLKLSSAGAHTWSRSMGGPSGDVPTGMATDAAGSVYTTGYFQGTADFDPGAPVFNLVSGTGNQEAFISKLDISGNFAWAIRTQSPAGWETEGVAMTLDLVENILITGWFESIVDFDPGACTYNLSSNGDETFIMKLSTGSAGCQPKIVNFTPSSGPVGSTVSLSMTGGLFSTTPSQNIVYFGAARANVTAATSTTLTVTVPTGATFAPITVTVAGLTAYAQRAFLVTFPDGGLINACSFSAPTNFSTGNFGFGLATGDLDLDGKPDIVISNSGASTLQLFRNTSTTGTLDASSFAASVDLAVGANVQHAAIADVDGDGKLDLLAAGFDGNIISIFRNISTPGILTAGSFQSRVDLSTGGRPVDVEAADLDGDGRTDIVVATEGRLSFWRNIGTSGSITTGSFDTRQDIFINSITLAVSDLDVDGKPDLVLGPSLGTVATILRNVSTPGTLVPGSFAAGVNFTVGAWPDYITTGDLDNDQRPEIVTSSWPDGSISILKNTSSPGTIDATSFAAKVDIAGLTEPRAPTITDFDGDGKPDIALAMQISGKVNVYKNVTATGTINAGSFAPVVEFPAGGNMRLCTGVDFDGDGKPDIATTNWSGPPLSVIRNTVSSLPPPTIAGLSPNIGPVGSAVVINGTNFSTTPLNNTVKFNGITASVVAATSTSITTSVPAGATTGPVTIQVGCNSVTSGGNFTVGFPPPTITSISPASGPVGTLVTITGTNFSSTPLNNTVYFGATQTSVNTATATQLIVNVPQGATYQPLSVTVNNFTAYSPAPFVTAFSGTGTIDASSFAPKVDFSTSTEPTEVIIGDLDNDGKPDIATINNSTPSITTRRNTSTVGAIAFAAGVDFPAGANAQAMEVGDIDADGKLDLIAVDWAPQVSVFRNTGSPGTISFASRVNFTTGSAPVKVAIGDLDGDGLIDLVTANGASASVSLFRNTGSPGTISFAAKIDLATGASPYDVTVMDMDGDGLRDIIVPSRSIHVVSIFRNISTPGTLAFAARVDLPLGVGNQPFSVATGDLNGDNKPDIAVLHRTARLLAVIRNNSTPANITTGTFDSPVTYATSPSDPAYLAFGDVSGDGVPDVLVGNDNGTTVQVLKNTASPGPFTIVSFSASVSYTTGSGPLTVKAGDLDGDNRPDLVVANAGSNTFSVLRNQSASCVPAAQRAALIALYNATDGANWTDNTGWLSPDESTWYGVTVTSCHITDIQLDGNNLTGTIPPEIGDLPMLEGLSLGANQLSGSIPPEIGNLTNLIGLNLAINQLDGSVPPELGNLVNLQALALANNSLSGNLPIELENLSSLQFAFLGYNQFTGNAPAVGLNSYDMNTLQLQFNQLTDLPDLNAYTAISSVNVANNRLTFDDLEPYIGLGDFTYSPQAMLPPGGIISFVDGGTLSIPFSTGGSANSYQWYKGTVAIPGATSTNLTIAGATASDVGSYKVEVTSAVVPLLTLTSIPFTVITDPCPPGPRTGGALDASFAPLISAPSSFYGVAVQSTGKIITSTSYTIENSIVTSGVLRFNPDGSRDNTFVSNSHDGLFLVLPDDRIIATYADGTYTYPIRLDADGNEDAAFNTSVPQYYSGNISALALQPNGKILVGATAFNTPPFVERINTDGTSDGLLAGADGLDLYAIRVQTDGAILLGGQFPGGIIRLDPSGAVDPSFNPIAGASDFVTDIAIQTDGKILVAGMFAFFNDLPHYGIVRLNPNGSIDNTFTALGITDLIDLGSYVSKILIQPDDKIILAGSFIGINGAERRNLVRLNPDGTVDCLFDPGVSSDAAIEGLAIQTDGKVLISGSFSSYEGTQRYGLARVNGAAATLTITLQPSDVLICDGGVATFSTAATGTTNITYQWQYSPNGIVPFTDIANGGAYSGVTTSTLSINTTGMFGAGRYQCRINGDGAAQVVSNDEGLFVYAIPTAPPGVGGSACGAAAVTLTSSGISNGNYRWYTVATGGTAIAGAFNDTYVTPVLASTTTYYVAANNGVCESPTRTPVVATINTIPAAPTTTGGAACGPNPVLLTAAGSINGNYRWYTVSSGGTAIAGEVNSTYATPVLFATTTYYVSVNNGTCESATRTAVTATINALPAAPTTTGATDCASTPMTLTASGGINGQYRWYTVATGGTAIGGEVNSTYLTPPLTVTTTYFVAINDGTCESTRTPVTATVSAPSKPTVSTSNCTATGATLTGPAGFANYAWSNGATTQQIAVTLAGSYTLIVTTSAGCTSPVSDPVVFTSSFCNQPPTLQPTTVTTTVQAVVSINLSSLASDLDNNIDLSTLQIIAQPASGAIASINANFELVVDYSNVTFAGTDQVTVQVCDVAGACVQEVITIEVSGDITVFNALSPNGDGKNDVFYIQYIDALPDTKNNKVTIFNRWGSVVFEVSNYDNVNNVFRGIGNNGSDLPPGTYYYTLEFSSGTQKRTGFISLKR